MDAEESSVLTSGHCLLGRRESGRKVAAKVDLSQVHERSLCYNLEGKECVTRTMYPVNSSNDCVCFVSYMWWPLDLAISSAEKIPVTDHKFS